MVFGLDIIAISNTQEDYAKTRNYWKYLKTKLKKEVPQLVSGTNQLKLTASDGKRYKSDALDAQGVTELAKTIIEAALTTHIDDREMFMNGIDSSYYYEQND